MLHLHEMKDVNEKSRLLDTSCVSGAPNIDANVVDATDTIVDFDSTTKNLLTILSIDIITANILPHLAYDPDLASLSEVSHSAKAMVNGSIDTLLVQELKDQKISKLKVFFVNSFVPVAKHGLPIAALCATAGLGAGAGFGLSALDIAYNITNSTSVIGNTITGSVTSTVIGSSNYIVSSFLSKFASFGCSAAIPLIVRTLSYDIYLAATSGLLQAGYDLNSNASYCAIGTLTLGARAGLEKLALLSEKYETEFDEIETKRTEIKALLKHSYFQRMSMPINDEESSNELSKRM